MTLYHWTLIENARRIDTEGLKHGTWCIYLCRNPKVWHGEVCYKVNIDREEYELSVLDDWQIMCWNDIPVDCCKKLTEE